MSEVQVPRSPVEPALSLKSELEAYDRDKDRRSLLGALKEQFLLNRLVAASQAENTRNLGLQILFNRMEHMSDKMLLKTIRMLSEIGARDLMAVTGVSVSGGRTPMFSIQLPGRGSQLSLDDRSASDGAVRANCNASAGQGAPSYRAGGRPPHSDFDGSDFDRLDGGQSSSGRGRGSAGSSKLPALSCGKTPPKLFCYFVG
jgi:hypothetical protein